MLSVLNAPFKALHIFRSKNIQAEVSFTGRIDDSEERNKMFEDDIYLLFDFSPVLEREFNCCELMNKISTLQNMPFLVTFYN